MILVLKKNNPNKNRDNLYGDYPVPVGSPRDTNAEWYPLTEISDFAQFFSDGIESNDIIQGCLGNYWFISALSELATKDYLLRDDGLIDLTGLNSKKIVIDSYKMNNSNESDKLSNILLTNSILEHNNKNNKQKDKIISAKYYTRNKTMIGCSVKSNGNNMEQEVFFNNRHTAILAWHAYSILDVFDISKPRWIKRKKSRLIRIRNPWGRKEWKMEWW